MANLVGLFALGSDAELRYMPNGEPVLNMSLAFNYGPKDNDGKRASQWIDAGLYGKRAESLAEHLTKGTKIYAVLEDPHIETWPKKDGTQGTKLVARIASLEFAGSNRQATNSASTPAQNASRSAGKAARGFDDSDIPF